jgi:predicted dehydrogenase
MSEPIRVGVVGAGGNTRSLHIPNLQAIDGVALVGVGNRSRDSSRRVAEEFGIPRVYATWREAVSDPEVDAVVIGTWPNMHCRVTVAALEADKHVLCEARMSRDAAEAHEMLRAAQARPHLVAQVVPSPFSLRVDATVGRLLAQGYLGEILAIEVRIAGSFLDRESSRHWRQDTELSGFNVMSLGIWYETIMRWVGEAARVTAMGRVFVKTRKDGDGTVRAVGVPEHVDVIAEMVCGAQAHFQISSVAALGGANEILLFGSDGTLRFSGARLYGARRGENELSEIEIPEAEVAVWRVEEEFIGAIRGTESVKLTTFQDGVRYMEFTEAVARSSMTGAAISLPLPS